MRSLSFVNSRAASSPTWLQAEYSINTRYERLYQESAATATSN